MSSDRSTESSQKIRTDSLLSALEDMVSIVDKDYRYVEVSKGYSTFFGVEVDEIAGKHVSEIHGNERFLNNIKPFLDKSLAGEEVNLQFWGENHKGELRYLDSKHTPYFVDSIGQLAVAVVARDITELIQAQVALEKERSLLNTMINAMPDFIFTKDQRGIYQNCNESFEEFLDLPRNEIIGRSDFEIMSEASAIYITEKDSQVIRNRQPVRVDEWVTYQDGRKRLLDMYKLPRFDSNDQVIGIIAIGRNVTHEREVGKKLSLAALVFDAMPDPCLILSSIGTILSSNLAAKEQFSELQGVSKELLTITDLFYSSEADTTYLKSVIQNQQSWHGEVHSTDHRHYIATLNSSHDNLGRTENFVLTLRDSQSGSPLEKSLISKAYNDSLTGLPNRLIFMNRLENAIVRAERQRRKIAVFFIDLDKFKPINDQHGHLEGDRVLTDVAQRLKSNVRETDTLARLGGDEFVALIDIDEEEQAGTVARKFTTSLFEHFEIGPQQLPVKLSVSIGISLFPKDAGTAEALLKRADEAMYEAKNCLNEGYKFYGDCQ